MAITGTKGTRALSKRYPPTSGLTAETTKQEGRISNLLYTEGTNVSDIKKKRYQ